VQAANSVYSLTLREGMALVRAHAARSRLLTSASKVAQRRSRRRSPYMPRADEVIE
jgi:hypothetical protein